MRTPFVLNLVRIGVLATVGFTIAAGPSHARQAAATAETIRVPGLKAAAEICIDKWGVPHIYAKSEADAFFVQGFNAARDRLFQIDLWRRRGLGQLSEVFGADFVEQDRAARLFLYREDMDREWRIYSSNGTLDAQPPTERFVEGINAYVEWLKANPESLPWEMKFVGYLPATWTAADVSRIRAHGLTRNLVSEVARANTLCKAKDVDADQVRFGLTNDWKAQVPEGLEPCLPADLLKVFQRATRDVRVTKPSARTGQASMAPEPIRLAALEEEPPEGSNSWVVAPSKSATGRAIMADDPHRAYSAPSLRYLVHVSAPGLDVIGAGEPALPGISLGHNGTIAFGLTIFNIDQEDLYTYELNPADPTQYRYNGGGEAFKVLKESLAVKGSAPREIELVFTRHGPVILVDTAKGRAYAVRSAWLQPGMSPYVGSLEELWQLRHLGKGLREAVLKPEAAAPLASTDMNVMLLALEKPDAWFGENAAAKRDKLLLATLRPAWEEMEKLQGPEPALWQWGKLHFNLNEHPFAPAVEDAMRVRINVGPIAKNGSEFTPSQSLPRASDLRQMNGPSVRLVVDVGNWDNSRAVNHPGQSGDPERPHYRDLAPLWRDGRYFRLAYTRKAVDEVTERIIYLVPAK